MTPSTDRTKRHFPPIPTPHIAAPITIGISATAVENGPKKAVKVPISWKIMTSAVITAPRTSFSICNF